MKMKINALKKCWLYFKLYLILMIIFAIAGLLVICSWSMFILSSMIIITCVVCVGLGFVAIFVYWICIKYIEKHCNNE